MVKLCRRSVFVRHGWALWWVAAPFAVEAQPIAGPAALQVDVNTVWVALCAALVFFMQAGFALLESGMVRAKNAVNVIMKNYCDMCFGAVVYWALGYGLMFGANATGWFGASHFVLSHASAQDYTWMLFQMMFAATAATIVSGAIAERTRFAGYIVGSVVITAFIYAIFGAWAWGGTYGGQGWLKRLGFIDFAGSTVVHLVGACCALAALLVIRPRLGRFDARGQARYIPGHNLGQVALGGLILWLGWFGFNGGSTLAAHAEIGRILLNTHLAGAAGAVGALFAMTLMRKPRLMSMTVNASIGGLVAITAGCATTDAPFAILIGLIGGVLVVLTAPVLEHLGIDDVVGAVSVHGVCGIWGTLAAGLFKADALFDWHQVGIQALGVGAAIVWTFPTAWLMYWLIDKTIGLRASSIDEQRGLDYSEHFEIGYPEFQREHLHQGKTVSEPIRG